jgi:hypothetical protein
MKKAIPTPVAAGIAVVVLAVLCIYFYRTYLNPAMPEQQRVGPSAMMSKSPGNGSDMSEADKQKMYRGGH